MNATVVCTALLLSIGLVACDRGRNDDAGAPPVAGVEHGLAPAAAPVVATETTMAEAGVQPAAGTFDSKSLAGVFSGTLPCADCPGIDERLVLSADGGFELVDAYRERPGSEAAMRGNWSIEPDGRSLRLDPASKDAQDRLFSIEDGDTLVPLGADGKPTGAPGEPRLRRSR